MDAVYTRGAATATEVLEALPDAPTRTTVRTLLRILEEKGHLRHELRGRAFVYRPIRKRQKAGQSALRSLLTTFFDGSLEKAVTAHLSDPAAGLDPAEIARLEGLLRKARNSTDASS